MAGVYQVVVTNDAQRNLKEIIEYLGEHASFEVAERFVMALKKSYQIYQ